MGPDYPPFEEAVDRLRSLAKENGLTDKLAWVETNDFVWFDGQAYVKVPNQRRLKKSVERCYLAACATRLGVELFAAGQFEGTTYACIYAPADKRESEELMMPDGLKLTVLEEPKRVQQVSSPIRWHWLRLRDRWRTFRDR